MYLARIASIGLIVAAVAGCNLGAAIGSPGPVMNSTSMTSLSAVQMCSLLTADEATAVLGVPLLEPPAGIATGGQDSYCTYRAGAIGGAVPYIRVEINGLGFSGQATLVNLHRGAHTLNVGGYQAVGADAQKDPSVEPAVLSVKVAQLASDPALWIEAPTSAIARQAAVLILPRLAALP